MFSLIVDGSKDFVWTCSAGDVNLGAADLKRHVVSFDSTTSTCFATNVTDGGAASTTTLSGTVYNRTSKYSLSMFSRLGEDSAVIPSDFYGPTKMKVYGAKVYESGTLVKTYTPCLKGGVPGFRVSGPNIESFVTGVDISKVKYGGDIAIVKDDPYLSTGDYNDITTNSVVGKCIYFDTGYVVKPTSRVELDFAPLTPNIPMSGYNHAPEFMYAQGSNRNEMEIVGRTSTGYLFDKVTVDRSIISRLRNREDAPQLLKILMSYAQSCSKRITVEGVENIDDLRKFSGLPLECLQGFYFSHPLSAELFEDFVFSHAKSEPHDSPAPAAAAIPSFNSAPAADSSEVLF